MHFITLKKLGKLRKKVSHFKNLIGFVDSSDDIEIQILPTLDLFVIEQLNFIAKQSSRESPDKIFASVDMRTTT